MKNPPTGPYIPPTPKATVSPSPFPVAESDEPNGRTPSPRPYHFQRRQSFIDPDLVSFAISLSCMTLKDLPSRCTSVSF